MGDDQDNSLAVSFDAAGSIVVNSEGDFVTVQGGTATVANTRLIQIFGLGGNDELIWSRSANLQQVIRMPERVARRLQAEGFAEYC